MESNGGPRRASASPHGRTSLRVGTLVVGLTLVLVAMACGKAESRTPDAAPETTVSTAAKPTCASGAFPIAAEGLPKGFKLTGTGNAPGWYVWLAGPFLRVRLVSDPAKPLAPVPSTTRVKKAGEGAGVILSYTGELQAGAALGKVTLVPDPSAGLVDTSSTRVAFALNGQTTPVGFDVGVPCGTKNLKLLLNVPTDGGPKPAGVDKVFLGHVSHPLENPMVLTRVPDPTVPTTKAPAAAKPKATQPKSSTTSTTAAP